MSGEVTDKLQQARNEANLHRHKVAEVEAWFQDVIRWKGKYRNYTAKDVASLRGSITEKLLSHHTADKLYKQLRKNQAEGTFTHTFGCLDTVQANNLVRAGLEAVYVSGWQCSSTHTTNNEFGPDFADYPADTVPSKVQQLCRSLLLHDRMQSEERSKMTLEELEHTPKIDYLTPIVADGDAGFGGVTSVMKLTKMLIEAGAAAIHLEDQRSSSKKCGHLGGKVLISVREAMEKLNAARLQADIMGVGLVIMARTDALDAKYLDSNMDPIDQPYILGVVDPGCPSKLMTFVEAGRFYIEAHLKKDPAKLKTTLDLWEATSKNFSLSQAHDFMKAIGIDNFYFDWEACRSPEGFYQIKGCLDYCIKRCVQFSKIADLLWMETAKPCLKVAKTFAEGVKLVHPHQMLAYNLSPSFNWDASGMNDKEILSFVSDLGRLGFCFQFITLAGFHMDSLISTIFTRQYKKDQMMAYVKLIQRREKEEKVVQLKHQKWSGVELRDRELHLASGGVTSTKATSSGITETQFSEIRKAVQASMPKPKL